MVLAKELAKEITLPSEIVNNDAFIYLTAKKKMYLPRYISNLSVLYRSPATLSDHVKQSRRFQHSLGELEKYFDKEIKSQYAVPRGVFMSQFFKYLTINPFLFSGYLIIFLRTRLSRSIPLQSTWSIAVSTKTV